MVRGNEQHLIANDVKWWNRVAVATKPHGKVLVLEQFQKLVCLGGALCLKCLCRLNLPLELPSLEWCVGLCIVLG